MPLYCSYCDEEQAGEVCDNGSIACGNCGKVILDEDLVDDVQFMKGPDGHCRMQGTFVKSWDGESASVDRSISKGQDRINMLIKSSNMDYKESMEVEDMAMKFYRRAVNRHFTRRYKIDYVATACLYLACRAKKMPYLLIDFSEKLAVNVYVIGAVYLQLCLLLYLQDDPIVQKPVDPSLFIHKFTQALVQKLENDTTPKEKRINTITHTAMSIIASMKRDWMQTGRKPSGLCGAAIYIAALSEGIRFPKSEVINVVHVCEATLTKRLIEFENTESGSLTIEEFTKRAEDYEREQLDACTNKSGRIRTEILCKHKDREVFAHGLCKKCSDKFIKLSGGLEWDAADPPSFQRPESEQVTQNASENINNPSTDCSHQEFTLGNQGQEDNNFVMTAAENLAEPQFNNNNSVAYKESEDLSNDEPECLSDIDDKEVSCYLNNKEEAHFKKIIWEQMNKDYIKKQQDLKELAKAGSDSDTAEMTDEMREARKLAAAASAAVASARKQKRQQRAPDASNVVPPRTAAEAIAGVLSNKGHRKINLAVLQKLFNEEDAEHASKKLCKDPEEEFMAEEKDADNEQEEADYINNYDEVDQDYQVQEDYEPEPYYNNNNNDHYYDGNDEPDNYGYDVEYW